MGSVLGLRTREFLAANEQDWVATEKASGNEKEAPTWDKLYLANGEQICGTSISYDILIPTIEKVLKIGPREDNYLLLKIV